MFGRQEPQSSELQSNRTTREQKNILCVHVKRKGGVNDLNALLVQYTVPCESIGSVTGLLVGIQAYSYLLPAISNTPLTHKAIVRLLPITCIIHVLT